MKRRFTSLGLSPIEAGNLATQIDIWIKSSGENWTVDRLKKIKLLAIKWIFDQPDFESPGISLDDEGKVRGPFKVLFSKNNVKRILPLLQSHTAFKSDIILPHQWEKFINAVEGPIKSCVNAKEFWKVSKSLTSIHQSDISGDYFYANPIVVNFINTFSKIRNYEIRLEEFPFSEDRFKPLWALNMKSVPESGHVLDELSHFYQSKPVSNWLTGRIPWSDIYTNPLTYKTHKASYVHDMSNLYRILTGVSVYYNPSATVEEFEPTELVGKISFLQEPGHKLRSVANPFRIHQVLLHAFGKCMWNFLKTLPWDATFDQNRFDQIIHDHLKSKKKIYSVDLSSFTDNFPLDFQVLLVEQLITRSRAILKEKTAPFSRLQREDLTWLEDTYQYLSLFWYISRGEWYCSERPEKPIIWTKGQPLGLYPSFPLASLCHGMLLLHLCKKEYQPYDLEINRIHDNQFFVLGDDVVILNQELYESYRHMLDLLGSPVSEEKTFCSDQFSEFAGKIITKSETIKQYKWYSSNEDNFLDLLKNFGMKILNEFSKPVREVAEICAEVPDVITGLGCGFNPKGIPLKDRISKYAHLIDLDPKYSKIRVKRSISHLDLENYMNSFSELHEILSDYYSENFSFLNREKPSTDDLLNGINLDLHPFILKQMKIIDFYHLDDQPKMIQNLINSETISYDWGCSRFYVDCNYFDDIIRFYNNVSKCYHLTIVCTKTPTLLHKLKTLFG